MKPIVVFPRGALKADDRKQLIAEGYLPIETDAQVKVIVSEPSVISGGELARCAIYALARANYHTANSDFVYLLAHALNKNSGDNVPLK